MATSHTSARGWHRSTARALLAPVVVVALSAGPFLSAQPAGAATSASVSVLAEGSFEQAPPQTVWTETQNSGGELIDGVDPHSGALAADLCDIDNCSDGHGNAGDQVAQTFTAPGQVVSAQLSFFYNDATSEPDQNVSCKDWLSIGLGVGKVPAASATRRYCASTGGAYRADSIDVTAFLQGHGGQAVAVQAGAFTDNLNPSQFFVDDVSLTVTYLLTPSAPVVTPVADCGAGETTLSWTPPAFPLGSQWPVQSYLVTPYDVTGAPQPGTTVAGTQTSLPVSLHNGTVCYFTVTATNANGTGPAGSPAVPVAAVVPLSAPASTGFTLQWSLQPASAPATSYIVFIRDGSGPWLKWGDTTGTSSIVYGAPGHTYQYYVEGFNTAGGSGAPSGNGQTGVTVPASATPAMSLRALYGVDAFGALHPAASPPLPQTSSWTWPIARGIAVAPSGAGGYVLDGWGGVHPFGNAPAVGGNAYWPGWDITRSIALRPDGVSGYVLDAWGGVHPFGGAPALTYSAYWPGWDIARKLVLNAAGTGGYVLDAWGGIHSFGAAPAMTASAYWRGWDIARDIVLLRNGSGGYVLDGWGGVHQFGSAPALTAYAYWPGWDIARGLVLIPSGTGGYVADGLGGFHPLGSVQSIPGTPNYANADIMRGVAGA
ncbi:MAG: fibronectin type III domain-containing protein [Candidatus Dormibacteraeota bacterium]|nr:fibronectin type III domain-containing protein [Candidatus Dormibacteraeota bacterium]